MSKLIDVYIGRQPILDRKMNVFAYELLFRSGDRSNRASITAQDNATAQVLMNLIGNLGLREVVGNKKAFVNFTEAFLLNDNPAFFPKSKIVIEVLETVQVTPKIIRALADLNKKGYTLALDDYTFNPKLKPLEPFAKFIKVDILEVPRKDLIHHVKELKDQGVRLLAEKVETREQFEFCRKIGFDYFQGYFFAKPKVIEGRRLPNNKLTLLELLATAYDPDVDLNVLTNIISRDVALSQKLIKFVSSISERYSITSIHDAILHFGMRRLQSWISMLALASADDKPTELFTTSLVRAKFCELVGERLGQFKRETYFMVGLFSTLDAIMDAPLSEVIKELNLDEKINAALLSHEGLLGQPLVAIQAIERSSTTFPRLGNLSATELSKIYLAAMKFAESIDIN